MMIIENILFFLIIRYISQKNELNIHYVKSVMHFIWFTVTLGSFLYLGVYDSYAGFEFFSQYLIHTINITYIYEMLYHKVDFAHKFHHILTIILQLSCLYGGMLSYGRNIALCSTAYLSFPSSIISPLRTIYPNSEHIKLTYYVFYIFGKTISIIIYYDMLLRSTPPYPLQLSLYAIVHLVQIYFSYKILSILRNYKPKTTNQKQH